MGLAKDSPFHPVEASRVILDGAECMAFFDRYPVSEGHALVVPNRPVSSLYDLEPQVQAKVWEMARRVRGFLEARYQPAGFNIGINDGRAAGQTIAHAHVHVIPRYAGDASDPRGGIRWVIPGKAKYWQDPAGDPGDDVVGIDVGLQELHLVALGLKRNSLTGTFTVLGNGVPVEEAVRICLERKPACIAIDSPPAWAVAGNARKAEMDLNELDVRIFFVPGEQEGQTNPFYGWMRTGFRMFAELGQQYPRYRDGRVDRHALEVFPHATAVVLAGRHRPHGVSKAAWRKQVLAEQGYDVSALRNADCVDAALAAVTAAHALRGSFTHFGDPAEGVIVTPHGDAGDRFRRALTNER
jgi:diadenosine tetraphosphate (Ap4A) HIT family hydrolase/predicted nuclease with RNAse H fold